MTDKRSLNIEENIKNLLKLYPQFSENINEYHDPKQGDNVKLSIFNTSNPRFSLSVTMYEFDGIYIDFGDMSIVEQETSVNDIVLDAISDVLNDKCIVVLGYKNDKTYEDMKSYFGANFFESTEEECNSLDKYYSFIKKLSLPVKGFKRFFRFYKGIIEASNWSGSQHIKLRR